jgi:hypothetical protein
MNADDPHNPSDSPPQLRCLLIRVAIAMTWLAFSIFVFAVILAMQQEGGMLPSLLLLGASIGVAHGVHRRLKGKRHDTGIYEITLSQLDIVFVTLSFVLLVAGTTLFIVAAFG